MITVAYTCVSKLGPYECGPTEYYVSAAFGWLLFGLVVAGGLFWVFARIVAKVREPEDRRQRALDRLDEAARRREAAERPPDPHSPWRSPRGPQPW